MIDVDEKELLGEIDALTTLQDEEGERIPNYCFATDLTTDLECTEEEVSRFALMHGYRVFIIFPGETMAGGLVIVPADGTIEPVRKMYEEFYGEAPEVSEMALGDDGALTEKNVTLDEKKGGTQLRKVGDPNAKAMWGRTRSQTFRPGRGKGSFTRKQKHRGIIDERKAGGRKKREKENGCAFRANAGNVKANVAFFNHVMGSDSTCLEAADTKAVDSADSACYNFPEEGKETVMKKKTEEKKSIVNEAGNDIKANQFAEFAKRFWDAHPELKKDLGR